VELADALGLSSVHVNRVMQDLRRDELIHSRGKYLSVPDWRALEEAGGFDPERAQLKKVKVVRTKDGRTQTFIVNLKGVQTPGDPVEIFYLKIGDIVIVPQKLVIF